MVDAERFASFLQTENHEMTNEAAASKLMFALMDDPSKSPSSIKFSSIEVGHC